MASPLVSVHTRRPPKFGCPDNQRVLQHAPLLEIAQQSRNGPVDVFGQWRVSQHIAVGVPIVLRAGVDEFDNAYAALRDAFRTCREHGLVRPLSEAGPGRERKARIAALREGWAWAPRRWTAITDDTGVGDPSASTAAKGEKFFAAVTERIGGFLVELASADVGSLYAEQ